MNARKVFVGLWLTLTLICWAAAAPLFADNTSVVMAVKSIGMTVSDMDRSAAFYSDVLGFKPISDVEVDGPEYDQLWSIFGVRARVVRMQLGEEQLELIEFLAPPDVRPIPVPSYSHDLWFQHFAIVVSDMEAAWAQLR
jgi:catechol 2,3-dioxygenase-like lactoylglutathione lyase family enzyme